MILPATVTPRRCPLGVGRAGCRRGPLGLRGTLARGESASRRVGEDWPLGTRRRSPGMLSAKEGLIASAEPGNQRNPQPLELQR